jgi:hypothetical protein
MATTAKQLVYVEGIGRRKTATARVRLTPAKETTIVVNDKPHVEYFKHAALQQSFGAVLDTKDAGIENYTITVKVQGGGLSQLKLMQSSLVLLAHLYLRSQIEESRSNEKDTLSEINDQLNARSSDFEKLESDRPGVSDNRNNKGVPMGLLCCCTERQSTRDYFDQQNSRIELFDKE